ncbi:hypothetical protein BDV23DRAFT_157351 [Aspergillus alliaceus]|uniref:Uncharacterized protein n=1 Tax=Petromyces alliaceus TaxID=209559 RepID=A0A5N7C5L7_PETAA|nr:hypothetical protein BDV23DRAFT_157351 [Aspergillus alliaceus]
MTSRTSASLLTHVSMAKRSRATDRMGRILRQKKKFLLSVPVRSFFRKRQTREKSTRPRIGTCQIDSSLKMVSSIWKSIRTLQRISRHCSS